MTLDELKQTAKIHSIKVGIIKRALYTALADSIQESSDEIIAVAEGFDKDSANAVPVVVTEVNVYLARHAGTFAAPVVEQLPREDVEGVAVSGALLKAVRIRTAGGEYYIDRMDPDGAKELQKALS